MIYYNRGAQTIRWVPMDQLGAPRVGSATYSIVDLREPEDSSRRTLVASTSATASTVSTTTDAAAGPDTASPRRIGLTSTTGVRTGGVYLIEDPDAATSEAFTVMRVDTSAGEVEATRALTRAFPSGSTVVGLEVEGTFPATDANDEVRLENGGGPFQATWVYTLDSVLYVAPQQLWLTRYGMAPWVRFSDCAGHLPGLAQYVGEAVDPVDAIRAATDDYFERMLATSSEQRDPSYFRGNLSADLFIRKRAIFYMLVGSRDEGSLALAEKYEMMAEGHIGNLSEGRGPRRAVSVDHDTDTAPSGQDPRVASRLFVTP